MHTLADSMINCVALGDMTAEDGWLCGSLAGKEESCLFLFYFTLGAREERYHDRCTLETRGNTLLMLGKTLSRNLQIISLAEGKMDANVPHGNFDDDDDDGPRRRWH